MLRAINPYQITKALNAAEYLDLLKNKKAAIIKSEIISPKLGAKGLGGFRVTYKTGYTLKRAMFR